MMLVGLAGEAGSGKETAGEVLASLGFNQLAYADPIRELLYRINPFLEGTPAHSVSHIRYRDAIDTYGYEWCKRNLPEVRQLMQDLGQGARDIISINTWTYVLAQKLPRYKRAYISDVRQPGNEVDLIRESNGYIIAIERPGYEGDKGIDKTHPSERDVHTINADIKIINEEGKIDKFKADIRSAVHTLFGSQLYAPQPEPEVN